MQFNRISISSLGFKFCYVSSSACKMNEKELHQRDKETEENKECRHYVTKEREQKVRTRGKDTREKKESDNWKRNQVVCSSKNMQNISK